jgi:capsular polysaccharide export protein
LRPIFPFYRTHRPQSFLLEAAGWFKKLMLRKRDIRASRVEWEKVKGKPYFTLPLQLDSDYQIRVHSPFGNMRAALRFVIKSFARYAPEGTSLLVKRHPLDSGLVAWERLTRRLAAHYGVEDRIFYLADWDIAEVVGRSLGVVTVNSTVGTLALNQDKPVLVLGHAVYKVPGVVYKGTLDEFWLNPGAPDQTLYAAFRRVLIDRCLIRGGLLSDQGLAMLVGNAVDRLCAEPKRAEGAWYGRMRRGSLASVN